MSRRWLRGRQGGDRRVAPSDAPRSTGAGDADRADETDDGDTDDELSRRLDAVTSGFRTPPTAEQLRAAFSRRTATEDEPPLERPKAFQETYTAESLFQPTIDEPPVDDAAHGEDRSRTRGDYYYDPQDAWAVLGLRSGASWGEIAAAHRRLAKEHHPDRQVDATPEERAASEATMRDINVAYSVLRRLTGH